MLAIVRIALSRPLTFIGRHPGCDVRLDPSRVSRRHCCLALRHGEGLVLASQEVRDGNGQQSVAGAGANSAPAIAWASSALPDPRFATSSPPWPAPVRARAPTWTTRFHFEWGEREPGRDFARTN